MYITLGSAGLNILLNFLLVPKFGVYGAAYATVLSFAAFFMVKYWYAKKCYFIPLSWRAIIPYFTVYIGLIMFFNFIDLGFWLELFIKFLCFLLISIMVFIKYKKIIIDLIPIRR